MSSYRLIGLLVWTAMVRQTPPEGLCGQPAWVDFGLAARLLGPCSGTGSFGFEEHRPPPQPALADGSVSSHPAAVSSACWCHGADANRPIPLHVLVGPGAMRGPPISALIPLRPTMVGGRRVPGWPPSAILNIQFEEVQAFLPGRTDHLFPGRLPIALTQMGSEERAWPYRHGCPSWATWFLARDAAPRLAGMFHLVTHAFFKGHVVPLFRLGDPRHGGVWATNRLSRQDMRLDGGSAQAHARGTATTFRSGCWRSAASPSFGRVLEQGRDPRPRPPTPFPLLWAVGFLTAGMTASTCSGILPHL